MRHIDLRTAAFVCASLAALWNVAGSTQTAEAAPRDCTLPPGTQIHFHLLQPLSSADGKTGQTFGFALTQPILTPLGDCNVPIEGAMGSGTVLLAGRAGNLGHEGDLTLRLDSLRTGDGRYVDFKAHHFEVNGANRKAASAGLRVVPDAGIAAIFIHGKNIELTESTPILTYLDDPAPVTSAPPPQVTASP